MTQHRNRIRKKTKVALYIRVSSDEQVLHGYSLDAQREALIEYAEKHDMEVVDMYIDEGKTARKELKKRKEIFRLMDDIKEGEKGIEMILFIKIDRWFRNVADYHYIQRILDKHDVTWKATQEDYNTDTADGRMKVNIMLSVAENEADRTSERIKFVNESKIKKGLAIFGTANLPMGLKVEKIDGLKRVVIDPETAPIILEYIKHFKLHNSKRLACVHCNQMFNRTHSYTTYEAIFKNTLYYGHYKGVDNYCEALITKDEFDELVRLGQRNVKVNPMRRVYKFSGLIICPTCGCKMTGTVIRRDYGDGEYHYYRCPKNRVEKTCTYTKSVMEKKLEKYLMENLDLLIHDYLIQFEVEGGAVGDDARIKKEIKKLEDELARVNYRFQKNRMGYDEYDKECERLEGKITKLKSDLVPQKRDTSHLLELINSDWKTVYHTLTDENKRALWRSIIKSIKKTGKNSYDIEFY